METDFNTPTAVGGSFCRYAICDSRACDALHARLAPLEAALRGAPRMRPVPALAGAQEVSQLRQIYHFDPMKLLAVFERVSLHPDYVIEFLLHRPAPAAPPEALVYVRKRYLSSFIRSAVQFDMLFNDTRCALHHVEFEHNAEGLLQFFLLWWSLENLFRQVDAHAGGQMALYADAQKALFTGDHGDALPPEQLTVLQGLDLRPRAAFGENAATLQLHSFDWHRGVQECEYRIRYPHHIARLWSETLIPVAARC